DADHFVGKDSILSGPAGGVIGFSRAARQAGFERSIGFDMGGTSTDVSRFDGTYELEFETMKAGVRVVAPMLAIETVAAGGGSVCSFDGVKLAVGPQSAGAEPGPACYGRGGPLTVTDVNLYLGRLLPDRFPFPLDAGAVEQRLESLCAEVAAGPLGWECTPAELAEGFVEIANASMARAIRTISVRKGCDPADYALVTFGGAGAQHACGLARMLGMRNIVIHPCAGILSALGIGLADVRRFTEQAVLQEYGPELLPQLEEMFERLEQEATAQVRAEGVPEERIQPPERSLDMRYRGVESTIHIVCPEDGDYQREYERLHRQQYGYTHSGRSLEVVAARVSVVGATLAPDEVEQPCTLRTPEPARRTEVILGGQARSAGVYFREQLQPGDVIEAPAILCEDTSTILLEPGFRGRIASRGEVILEVLPADPGEPVDQQTQDSEEPATAVDSSRIDPVMLEVFNNLFASIAEQMGVTLQKTSCSTNVKERLDFSCAIFSPTGDLVVNAPHIPVHLGAMSETVRGVLADNPEMTAGDVFVTNDPYRGGSHLPDVTVVMPVHSGETGELLFLTAARAHHAEIGGIVPGSMPPFSRTLADEGVLIRNFRLVHHGQSRQDDLEQLLLSGEHPTRCVADNLSDVSAQVAACRMGAGLLLDQVAKYTLPVVQACMVRIQEAAAAKMRLALADIPDGVWSNTDYLDDGSPIAVRITVKGEQATVDFTGTGPVLATSLNANRAIVTAAVMYVFRCLIAEDIPLNSGVLEPVELVLPECLLNPPGDPDPARCPAVVGGNVETSQRVVDVLLGALEVAAASQGTMNNLTFGDGSFGYYETICGGAGATAEAAGADAIHTHMTNTRLTDAEIVEHRYPVRIREFSIRQGSGGAGLHRGGCGVVRKLEFLRPLKVSMLSERRGAYRPPGLNGGGPGAAGRNRLQSADGTIRDLGGKFAEEVAAGDLLLIETPGGGGWGQSADEASASAGADPGEK
ncbi:MAG: hydantoinase B/oxoprolinase family protein, partial [Planctomycetaceae bacterium]|nr:hydantoinase B/oxoprolinase family protein [Planctomycetaceae bacterium]